MSFATYLSLASNGDKAVIGVLYDKNNILLGLNLWISKADISPGALIFCLHLDSVRTYAKPEEQKALIDVELLVGAKRVLNTKPASSGSFFQL
jgi:hypothetical protein